MTKQNLLMKVSLKLESILDCMATSMTLSVNHPLCMRKAHYKFLRSLAIIFNGGPLKCARHIVFETILKCVTVQSFASEPWIEIDHASPLRRREFSNDTWVNTNN